MAWALLEIRRCRMILLESKPTSESSGVEVVEAVVVEEVVLEVGE